MNLSLLIIIIYLLLVLGLGFWANLLLKKTRRGLLRRQPDDWPLSSVDVAFRHQHDHVRHSRLIR